MFDPLKTEPSVPKPANLVVAFMPSWRRAEAKAILDKSDGASARLLARLIARENARIRIRAALVVLPASLLLIRAAPIPEYSWYISLLVSVCLTLATSTALTCLPSRLETVALETLSQGGEVQYIGPLLEVLQRQNLNDVLREKIKQALARLLPQCTQKVFDQFTPLQRRSLCGILSYDLRDSNRTLHLAVFRILGQWGDRTCLGILYHQATGEATIPLVQTAAQDSVEQMGRRLSFGSLYRIPEYTDKLLPQLHPNGLTYLDYQLCATCIMALRQMVPQLTLHNYKHVLSEDHRDGLYRLLTERSLYGNYRYGKYELFLEIIAAAGRLRDMRATSFLQIVALTEAPTFGAKQLRTAARDTLRLLEAEGEKEKESRTLLRSAAAPTSQAGELLRPVAPSASATLPLQLLRPANAQEERLPFDQVFPLEAEVNVLIQSRKADSS